MNILTFDIEEWYIEKCCRGNRKEQFQAYDRYLKSILDILDECNLKATFFCVGGLAKEFPEVVRLISDKGHEIGCHSNAHVWLNTLDRKQLKDDTETAIMSIEDVIGKKVLSYRAPAFSIGEENKWAFEVLAECGIERDSSIYPSNRDFGGYPSFPSDRPCIVKVGNSSIKEFPISLTRIMGKDMAYSGGGYFRFFPLWYIKSAMKRSDYVMNYFHIDDLMHVRYYLDPKEEFEAYFKQTASLKNRVVRMCKRSIGTRGAFDKMSKIVEAFDFVNLEEADAIADWKQEQIFEL